MSKSNWFRLDKHMLLYFQRDVRSDKEKVAFLDTLTEALLTDAKGMNPLADYMINEQEEYRAKAIELGRIGAQVKESLRASKGALGCLSPPKGALAIRTDGRTDGRTDIKPEDSVRRTTDGSVSGFGGDIYGEIRSISDADLPSWAARYCRDKDFEKSRGGFWKRLEEVGPDRFRSVLEMFAGEVEGGEEPRNRGSALQARLKKAVES